MVSRSQVSIQEKVAFLKRPSSYPDRPDRIDVIETHMSWVFLTRDYVYKLKKPVRSEYLDFSTVEARSRNCQAEVTLNRRLAPNIYLGVVPLTVTEKCELQLNGNDKVADWLVKTRRLPVNKMLDYAIQNHAVNDADVLRFSRVLANFYRNASPVAMTRAAYCRRFEHRMQHNQRDLSLAEYDLPIESVDRVTNIQQEFLRCNRQFLEARVPAQKIIEAHGDLRPEHICMTPEPVFIDCLEFNRDLRILDPLDELSYLSMECQRLDAAAIGDLVMDTYVDVTGDQVPLDLISFYKSCCAMVRAKIAAWHITDNSVCDRPKWRHRTLHYLKLADNYARNLQ